MGGGDREERDIEKKGRKAGRRKCGEGRRGREREKQAKRK
jgi:hypothetical protein